MISSTIFCDTCGVANRSVASFCAACGRRLHAALPGTTSKSLTGLLTQHHVLRQRYRIISQIGKGGFGAVYKAADMQFGSRLVAIKEMSQSGLSLQELSEATDAFKREALMLANLTHPNLPRIYDQFSDGGRWYLVMDFIEGETLEEQLGRTNGGRLPLEKALDIGIQLCTVLDYLHTRQPPIIFRDLKPANVMLTTHGHIYLIDFGIARHFKPGQAKDTIAFGSPGYAAPEQYGRVQTTPRSDVYSLGATLHQMLSGNDPSHTPFHFAPLVPQPVPGNAGAGAVPALGMLIMQMLEMDVGKRPASMATIKSELQSISSRAIHRAGAVGHNPHPFLKVHNQVSASAASSPAGGAMLSAPALPPHVMGATLCVCRGHATRVTGLAWSPDGKRIASSGYDKTVRIWDAATGDSLLNYRGHSERVLSITWSPDGKRIASAGVDRTVQIWDAATGNTIFSHAGHSSCQVNAVAWSADSKLVVSAGDDKTVQIWDIASGSRVYIYKDHTDCVTALAWAPDRKRIASASSDKTVRVWDPNKDTKQNIFSYLLAPYRSNFTYRGHKSRVNAVTWSSDSKRIASAGADRTVRVWDATTGREALVSGKRPSSVNAVMLSPDGRRVASGGNDKMVQVWNTLNGSHIFTYREHTGYVTAIAWSPDGSRIASAGVDRLVRVWRT